MMLPEKKRISTVILSKMGDDGSSKDIQAAPEADMREEGPLDMIVMDLMSAIEKKSAMGIKDALRAFIDHKDSESESEE